MAQLVLKAKRELNAYEQFQRELRWKQVGQILLKALKIVGISIFLLYYSMFYFISICIGGK